MSREFARETAFALVVLVAPSLVPAGTAARAEEPVDLDAVNRIRDEAFHRSQVMEIARHLTDVIGSRLTGSPQMKTANEWTLAKLAEWGAQGRLEPWGPFGRGWTFERSAVHMLRPHATPLVAYPKAWTPGTDGPVKGTVARAELGREEDFEKLAGKIRGKILLAGGLQDIAKDAEEKPFKRHDGETIEDLSSFPIPEEEQRRDGGWRERSKKRGEFRKKLAEFLRAEGAIATLEGSGYDHGIVLVQGGGPREAGEDPGLPSLVLAPEHYNWLVRLADAGVEVELEIDVRATFHDADPMSYNTVADFPGTDIADQVVMAGGHLDSWHAATGATDNAAGCAIVLEAARILRAAGLATRRTIRIALWSGEEQGLLGSRAWVADHLARRPEPEDPEEKKKPAWLRDDSRPLELLPEHEKVSAYFNIDNGSGRLRGIYCQENAAVRPIFEAWFAPFDDVGARDVTLRNTGSTDHVSFDAAGVPGFQFIQDGLDYGSRTHHTHLDTYDHLVREDLVQASAVLASFLYHAANRDRALPRKPLPPGARPAGTNGH